MEIMKRVEYLQGKLPSLFTDHVKALAAKTELNAEIVEDILLFHYRKADSYCHKSSMQWIETLGMGLAKVRLTPNIFGDSDLVTLEEKLRSAKDDGLPSFEEHLSELYGNEKLSAMDIRAVMNAHFETMHLIEEGEDSWIAFAIRKLGVDACGCG